MLHRTLRRVLSLHSSLPGPNITEVSELTSKGRGKLWSSVRDYLGVETKSREDIGEKELGHSFGINVFCAGAINYPLCKPMVYHDHD